MSGESAEFQVVRRSTSARIVQAIAEDHFLALAQRVWKELANFQNACVDPGHLVEEMAKLAIFLSFNHRETIPSAVVEELFSFVRKLPQVGLEFEAATACGYESWEETGLVAPDQRELLTELSGGAIRVSLAKDAQEAASIAKELLDKAHRCAFPYRLADPNRLRLTPAEAGDLIWDLVQVYLTIANTFDAKQRTQVVTAQLANDMFDVVGPFFASQTKAARDQKGAKQIS